MLPELPKSPTARFTLFAVAAFVVIGALGRFAIFGQVGGLLYIAACGVAAYFAGISRWLEVATFAVIGAAVGALAILVNGLLHPAPLSDTFWFSLGRSFVATWVALVMMNVIALWRRQVRDARG